MFKEPTIQDYSNWLAYHLDKAIDRARRAISQVESRTLAGGSYMSGRTVGLVFDAADEEMERGIDAALGELKRGVNRDLLDHDLLREATEKALRAFAEMMRTLVRANRWEGLGKVKDVVDRRLAGFDARVDFALHQFDVGHLDPVEPEIPLTMGNSINIGVMAGGAVQQGTNQSNQTLSVTINFSDARDALVAFEKALVEEPPSRELLAEIKPELDTIKAQLAKPSPSVAILTEAGRTLRTIIEGAAGGILAPHLISAASTLWAKLGIT
jgi:hypothetical protein